MEKKPYWIANLVNYVFKYRYAIVMTITFVIVLLGYILYAIKGWGLKDTSQVCTGFFIVVTLFFAALNYEFTFIKTKRDARHAKETLTFNTASEWHKTPLKDYQKTSIHHEQIFIKSNKTRTADDFDKYFEDPNNLDFKESLKGLLNSFETMSIGVYKGLIDKDFIKEFYKSIFKIYYVDYLFYIEKQRIFRDNPAVWINFTNLAEEWHGNLKENMKTGILKSSIITN